MQSMKYWTLDDVRHLPPEMHHRLRESGCLLGWQTTTTSLTLFKPMVHDILGSEPDVLVDVFALEIPGTPGVIGEIITTMGMWRKSRRYDVDMVEICRGTGFQFCSSTIPKELRPTTTTETWVDEVPGYFQPGKEGTWEFCDYIPGTPGYWKTETTVDPSDSWEVVNVIMVEWIKGVAFRRGIGKVLASAWERAELRGSFVYLG